MPRPTVSNYLTVFVSLFVLLVVYKMYYIVMFFVQLFKSNYSQIASRNFFCLVTFYYFVHHSQHTFYRFTRIYLSPSCICVCTQYSLLLSEINIIFVMCVRCAGSVLPLLSTSWLFYDVTWAQDNNEIYFSMDFFLLLFCLIFVGLFGCSFLSDIICILFCTICVGTFK